MEKAPFDVEAVGAENLVNQRLAGAHQPGAQADADGGGKQALPSGLIKKRAADKRSGCAQKLGDFDFFFAAQNLQADGVVRHEHESHAQGDGQKPENPVQKGIDLIERLHPFGVEPRGFHHRQFAQVLLQNLHGVGRGAGVGGDDKHIGQRVVVEHRHQILRAHALLQFLQPFLLADKFAFADARIFGEQGFHRFVVDFIGAQFHIKRDLRRFVELAEHGLAALHAQIKRQGQRHRDGEHQQNQQSGKRLADKVARGVAGGFEVEREIMFHAANLPSCRRKMRWP